MTESIFTTQVPSVLANTESTYTLGTVFTADVDGQVLGVRFYSVAVTITVSTGALYEYISDTSGTLLASKTGDSSVHSGWNEILFDTPVDIVAGQKYVTSWHTYNYCVTSAFFDAAAVTNGHLTALRNLGTPNGKFHDGGVLAYPDNNFNGNNYFVDTIFEPAGSPTTIDLTVANASQAQQVGNVALTQTANLSVQNASQAQQADSVVLGVGSVTLAVNNASQSQSVSAPALTQVHVLTIQNARQNQKVSTVAFTSVDGKRLELHELLLGLSESGNVYFQPPSNVKMQYPCIVYSRDAARTEFAGNSPYRFTKRYQVTVIDRNPDSPIPDKVARLPMCTYQRFFTADNLNHDIFDLYF